MTVESVAIEPEKYDAPALKGNFTTDAEMHLWCAQALAIIVGSREAMDAWNDDIQDALRYLLQGEVSRAAKALEWDGEMRRRSRGVLEK